MINNPAPIEDPLDYGGQLRITSPRWRLFFQNLFTSMSAVPAGANSSVTSISASTTLNSAMYFVKASGAITVTLPDAIPNSGKQYLIKKMDAGTTLTIDTTSSQAIDGDTTLTIDQANVTLAVESDGANWNII